MNGTWVAIAAVFGLTAVAGGALGAHALEGRLDARDLAAFNTAVRYQMYHALALLAVAGILSVRPSRIVSAACTSMAIGVVLFSGSIYGLVLLEWRWLGPITPIGGLALMAGWLLLAIGALRPSRVIEPHRP